MPTVLNSITINALQEYSSFIEEQLARSSGQSLWFRGSGKASYTLSPSIHRHPTITDPQEIIKLEKKILDRFLQRSLPFLPRELNKNDVLDVLFFMQHYGIPSRLLDWSENPFMALYFALTSAPYKTLPTGEVEFSEDSCIWVLDPNVWNSVSLKEITWDQGIVTPDNDVLGSFKPKTEFALMREKPIAMYGIHNSPRIVAQRGVFTFFGKSLLPMEQLYVNANFPQDCLIKLILPKGNLLSLINSLISIGITDSVVYPDLEGFSKELRRYFKFLV